MTQRGTELGSLLDDAQPSAAPAAQKRAPAGGEPGGVSRQAVMMGAAMLALVAAISLFIFQIFGGPPTAAAQSQTLTAIDSESNEVFKDVPLKIGDTAPWANPRTGRRTLFPAEPCYWTKDGKAKIEPTMVLLNDYAGKPGPTLCPDCGRKVVGRNPMPPAALMMEALQRSQRGG